MTERIAQQEWSALVTDIREHSRRDRRTLWQISLDRSSFTQDTEGVLEATARSGALLQIPVLGVEEDASGELWHNVEKPLQPGDQVTGRRWSRAGKGTGTL